jgi:hypothetical protein
MRLPWTQRKLTGIVTPEAGGGKVLQVVQTVKTSKFSTNSTSWVDITGLSLAITPSDVASKILVMAMVSLGATANINVPLLLVRDSTAILQGDTEGNRKRVTTSCQLNSYNMIGQHICYLDSPASVAELTYKIQICTSSAGVYAFINSTATDSDSTGYSRGASTITAMEIGP